MKLLFFFCCSLLLSTAFPLQANSASSNLCNHTVVVDKAILSGKVIDAATGKPLQGAVIYIHEAKMGVTTNANGDYRTTELPSGKYLVEVSYVGFASFLETIDLQGVTMQNFSLKYAVVENEAVTVTGVVSATITRQSPQPISVVKKADLFKNPSTNIIDALSHLVPGVASLSTGLAISKPVIRGLSYNRIITIHDGIRQEGQQWGDEHGIEVDEYSIQKAEVLKGPASLLYGSDGMGGAIHLVTNTPVERGTIVGNIQAQYNGNNSLWGGNFNLAGHHNNGFNWNVYATAKSAKDYQNKYDGKVLNSRFNEHNWGGYIGLNKSWGYSHLLVSSFNQQVGVVEGTRDTNTGQFLLYSGSPLERIATSADYSSSKMIAPYQGVNHIKIASDNNIALGTGRLAINIGYQKNIRKEFADPLHIDAPELYFDLATFNYNVLYQFKEKNGWRTTIGMNGMDQQNKNLAAEQLIPAYQVFDAGLFTYVKKTFNNKLTLSGGIRGDYRNLTTKALLEEDGSPKFNALHQQYSNWSGSIGMSYAATNALTLKANLSRGFRAPTVSELASNGKHEGTNRYEYGDEKLLSESSLQLDAGIELKAEHLVLMLNVFYNQMNNYIFYSKLTSAAGGDSLVTVEGDDLTAFKFRQAGAQLYGFEAKLDLHPHPLDWLHFSNSFAMVAGRFDAAIDGAQNLPFMPPARWLTELRGDVKKLGKNFNNLYAKIEVDNMFTQQNIFSAYNTETATSGYTLLNIGLGMEVMHQQHKIMSVYAGMNNLLDVAYQNHLSRLKYTDFNQVTGRTGVFNMGRNFTVKVNIPLNFKTTKH